MAKPKIRFEGCTDDWEQRKLREMSESYSGGTPSVAKSEYYGGDIPFIRSAEINSDFTELFITEKGLNNSSARLVNEGDILYALYGATSGEVGRARLKGAINQAVLDIQVHEGYDAEYLAQWLKKSKRAIVDTFLQGGQGNLSGTIVKGLDVDFPALPEQQRIGEYFSNLDTLITLHQRKCEETKTLKKYMLQKMFPKNGQTVPEIRFSGFTDDWEQRKLGELGTVQTCKRIFKEQTSEQGDIPFFKNGTIGLEPDSYISREVYEEFRRLYPYPEVGDTLISVVGSIGRTAEYTGKDEYFQDSNVVWIKTDGSINKKFLKISYQVIKWLIEGSTVKHLYNDNILRSEIVMPPSQKEQAKIAAYFDNLDHLITLHQRKCEELQNIKKFMLQNMFV